MIVGTAPKTRCAFACLVAFVVVVIGLSKETSLAIAGLMTIVVIMIYTAQEASLTMTGFLTGRIKMIDATPKVRAALADLFSVFVVVNGFAKETLLLYPSLPISMPPV